MVFSIDYAKCTVKLYIHLTDRVLLYTHKRDPPSPNAIYQTSIFGVCRKIIKARVQLPSAIRWNAVSSLFQ